MTFPGIETLKRISKPTPESRQRAARRQNAWANIGDQLRYGNTYYASAESVIMAAEDIVPGPLLIVFAPLAIGVGAVAGTRGLIEKAVDTTRTLKERAEQKRPSTQKAR